MAVDAVLTVWSRFWPVVGGGIGGMGDGPKVRRGPPLSDSRATGLETAAAIGSGIRCGKTRKFAHWR